MELLHLMQKYHVLIKWFPCRSVDKLEQVKIICEKNKDVESIVYPFDFSSSPPAAWKKLASVLNELEIGVLVNNAAVSHEFPVAFLDEG